MEYQHPVKSRQLWYSFNISRFISGSAVFHFGCNHDNLKLESTRKVSSTLISILSIGFGYTLRLRPTPFRSVIIQTIWNATNRIGQCFGRYGQRLSSDIKLDRVSVIFNRLISKNTESDQSGTST